MKNPTKLPLMAAVVAVLASSAAFADDPTLQTRLAVDRSVTGPAQPTTTVAVYADRHGVSHRTEVRAERTEGHTELRSNAHGGTYSVWVESK